MRSATTVWSGGRRRLMQRAMLLRVALEPVGTIGDAELRKCLEKVRGKKRRKSHRRALTGSEEA
jgi:hypothetical protein